VREFRQRKHEVRRRLRRLPRVARRKNSLRVERIAKMPSFADRAKVAGMPWVYSFGYRFDSNAAAHPTPLTIEQFLEERPDGILIRSSAGGQRPDPYYVAVQRMSVLLELASRHVDQTALEPGLVEVRAEFKRLRHSAVGRERSSSVVDERWKEVDDVVPARLGDPLLDDAQTAVANPAVPFATDGEAGAPTSDSTSPWPTINRRSGTRFSQPIRRALIALSRKP